MGADGWRPLAKFCGVYLVANAQRLFMAPTIHGPLGSSAARVTRNCSSCAIFACYFIFGFNQILLQGVNRIYIYIYIYIYMCSVYSSFFGVTAGCSMSSLAGVKLITSGFCAFDPGQLSLYWLPRSLLLVFNLYLLNSQLVLGALRSC